MLPGIAQVHVEKDGDDDTSVLVANAAPVGDVAVFLPGLAGTDVLFARDLELLADVIKTAEDDVIVRDFFNGGVGQHHIHAAHEAVPIVLAVEMIDDEKSTTLD